MDPVVNQNPPDLYANPDVNFFAATNFRNQFRRFGIKTDDRRRHMYIVGKTGMGKTTLLENMVLCDIYAGHGVGIIDPHGDMAEKIINYIPARRINDVVYFNPADVNYPIGFNILETVSEDHKHLVASGLMGIFKKIWVDMWSSRMEYILNNTILALLEFPGTTLLGINRMLSDAAYRRRIVRNVKDPVVKAFWTTEFASYNDRYQQEAVAPIQNKIGQFLSASVIRNIVAQVKSRIDVRQIMDEKKIFIMNLSKGRIGEDNSRLLGGMLVTKMQLSAMERVDMPEANRPDFFLYVDEFQNFATPSFANILSEARKYRLSLVMAHQYMEQLDETVLAAVIGNVGSILTFRVGSTDAETLAKEFVPVFEEPDLINLSKFNIYLKLMIDGVASRPFSATTLPPIGHSTGSMEKVVKVSRERYAVERGTIEDKISRWSGMEITEEDSEVDDAGNDDKEKLADNLIIKQKRDKAIGRKIDKLESPNVKKESFKSSDSQGNKKRTTFNFNKPINAKSIPVVDPKTKGISLSTLKPENIKTSEHRNTKIIEQRQHVVLNQPQTVTINETTQKNSGNDYSKQIDTKSSIKPMSKFLQYKNSSQPPKKDNLGFINQSDLDYDNSDNKIEQGRVIRFD